MKFIRISDDTLLNVAAISTIRFYSRDVTQDLMLRTGTVPTKTGVETLAEIVTLNGSKHTVSGGAADELAQVIKTA